MKRYEFWAIAVLVLGIWSPFAALARSPGTLCSTGALGPVACIRPEHAAFDICQHIEGASRRHLLDPGFFARLLWQESRFDANALSPAGAQGIAQFMPGTAALRGLSDSYNPAEAMEISAQYLAELLRRYGNAGLAAVAYNGGERRADGFMVGDGLAGETIDYVQIITGLTAEDWRDAPPEQHDFRLDPSKPFMPACLAMARNRKISAIKGIPGKPTLPKWGAQIGFGKTKAAAQSKAKDAARSCPAVVDAHVDIVFVKNRVRGRPGYHMARVSGNDRGAVSKICQNVRAQGCPCAVYKNW
ncbi:lytic transglycosylase domain-containing protein [uncultured Tateyamaria sp.]|uniref:lytic transglycosylase domain-containing protein n=1 Tax=uncultured Tateyamaria sp. TaxID=455651 RepID=UPI0026177C71|nr:lytic transglycosylase domain-containing protein [uncultured Tateyamaria sp.]